MSKQRLRKLIILTLLLILLSVACRKRDEPTPTPPAGPETAAPPTTAAPRPTAGPSETTLDYDWPPQVVYSSPAPGEEALLDGAITIRFDQPMDQESVEEAFAVQEAGATGEVEGSFNWPRPDTLIFTPKETLERKQSYEVQIAGTAASRNGQPLRAPVQLQVETVGFLEVGQVIPAPGTDDVQADAAITVLFNRPVVPLASTTQQAGLPQPLEISPAVSGQGEWVSTSIYRFVPGEPLAGATRYQVAIREGLQDVTGGVLGQDFTWNFTTLNPSVVTIVPENGAQNVIPTRPVTITFNMPMDQASTEAAVTLDPAAEVSYDWSGDGRVLVLRPADPFELQTNYTLTIDNSARSASGQATLDRETVSSFNIVPFPAVISTTPADGAVADRWQRGVNVQFASPMDLDTLEGQIVVEPAPDEIDNVFFDEFGFNLYLEFDLERNTEYRITIPGSAADPYGNTLGQDYTWQFRTPGFPPLVSLNLPDQLSQFSTSYPSNVDIIYRNVTQVDVQLYQVGLVTDRLTYPYFYDYVPGGDPLRTWTIPVESSATEANVYNLPLADGGTLPAGLYFLRLSAPEITQEDTYWQNQRNLIVVADTNLVVKENIGAVYVWATDLASGQPAAGRNLTLYNQEGQQIGTAVTDNNGLATLPYDQPDCCLTGVLVMSNQPGQAGFGLAGSAWNLGVNPWQFGLNTFTDRERPRFAYLHTDRPIYRPGDTVYFRGIVRNNNYGRYPLPTNQTATLGLEFSTNYETLNDFQFQATLDENGEFNGQYTIPEDARLGNYRLYFQDEDIWADRSFSVADYRRPEFQVTATPSQAALLRGQSAEVVIEASYFFGGPATDLTVNWTVYENSYTLPWEGPFYSFGDSGDFFYEDLGPFFFGGGGTFGNYLTGGEGKTDSQGRLVIELPADLLAEVEAGSRQITVEANVLDISNFPIAARTSLVFHQAETYVGVAFSDYLGTAGAEAEVDLITVNWNAQPVANQDVEVVFYRREWRAIRDEDFNVRYTRWEPEDTEVDRVQAATDSQGQATISFVPPEGGIYLAVATVTDDGGRSQTSSASFWASDAEFVGWRVDPKEKRMELSADRQEYRPGDTAQILVQSPFAGPVQAWLTIERGDVLEQRIVTLESNSDVLEIPITPDFAPNVFVTVVAVKGIDDSNPYADIRIGITELIVSPEHLTLDLDLAPQSDLLQPGEAVTYDILVTDQDGDPVSANLSLALVDLAVLSLKPDNAPPISEAFYQRQPFRSQMGSGLIYTGEGLEVEVPLEQLGLGGGGGGAEEAARTYNLEEDEVRRNFPDTAFWEAQVTTGEDGRATAEIPLPDSLTTWRLSSKAVSLYEATGETLVGQASVDVVATLPVLIRPVTPRFFTVGDVVQLGAIVHNNTGEPLEMEASLEAEGVTLQGPAAQKVNVASGGRQLVQWPVVVNDVASVDLTFRVQGGDYRDASKPTFGIPPDQLIPVTRYAGEDVVGTSGILDEAGSQVEAVLLPPNVDERQGELRLQLSPSLAAALLETLDVVNNLDERPACAHAITDQLLPNVATVRALQALDLDEPGLANQLDDLVRADIERLENLQKSTGGWGWCYTVETDEFLSAYTLLALDKAEEAGYSVDDAVLSRAVGYLNSRIKDATTLNEGYEVNRQAFFLYVLAEAGEGQPADLDDLFTEHRALLDPYARALLALAYDLSGVASDNVQSLLADLNDSVILNATGAHWEDAVPDWNNLNSDIRGTAIVLDALARLEPDSLMAGNTVRWLMVARTAGRWPTGQDTAWSILALSDWMAATSELEADYGYQVNINGRQLTSGQFDRSNVTGSESLAVPMSDLLPEEVNFLDFQRGEGAGRLYYSAFLDAFISAGQLDAVNRGIVVQRSYYDAACDPEESECQPITTIQAGQQVRVELTIIVPNDLVYAIVEDHIPAGAEAIDPGLATSVSGAGGAITRTDEEYQYGYWGWWYFNRIEYRDDRVVFYSDFLPAGTYQYTYTLQTTIPGQYQVIPAIAREEFFPDVFGRSEGLLFTITE
ncbi:MAG: Ig-like domain-containing protein [Chloroflexi bacterium]|nr:Ig-like domain-containing protein [Chloroflexota bacterium]MCI0579959.1 Ig-like domain-containing protein [Chloroflexota bacterium]MCI0728987.1 Ig-like domain-containing protein [Chloroflexota bacterium]